MDGTLCGDVSELTPQITTVATCIQVHNSDDLHSSIITTSVHVVVN